jgi:hypothetical protein
MNTKKAILEVHYVSIPHCTVYWCKHSGLDKGLNLLSNFANIES